LGVQPAPKLGRGAQESLRQKRRVHQRLAAVGEVHEIRGMRVRRLRERGDRQLNETFAQLPFGGIIRAQLQPRRNARQGAAKRFQRRVGDAVALPVMFGQLFLESARRQIRQHRSGNARHGGHRESPVIGPRLRGTCDRQKNGGQPTAKFCAGHNLAPPAKKYLGQNHGRDPAVARRV